MPRPWRLDDLIDAIQTRAAANKFVVLSPETAERVALYLSQEPAPRPSRYRIAIDCYRDGSCIYKIDHRGNDVDLVAWAQSSIIARRAAGALRELYPADSFSQRRRSFIED